MLPDWPLKCIICILLGRKAEGESLRNGGGATARTKDPDRDLTARNGNEYARKAIISEERAQNAPRSLPHPSIFDRPVISSCSKHPSSCHPSFLTFFTQVTPDTHEEHSLGRKPNTLTRLFSTSSATESAIQHLTSIEKCQTMYRFLSRSWQGGPNHKELTLRRPRRKCIKLS